MIFFVKKLVFKKNRDTDIKLFLIFYGLSSSRASTSEWDDLRFPIPCYIQLRIIFTMYLANEILRGNIREMLCIDRHT